MFASVVLFRSRNSAVVAKLDQVVGVELLGLKVLSLSSALHIAATRVLYAEAIGLERRHRQHQDAEYQKNAACSYLAVCAIVKDEFALCHLAEEDVGVFGASDLQSHWVPVEANFLIVLSRVWHALRVPERAWFLKELPRVSSGFLLVNFVLTWRGQVIDDEAYLRWNEEMEAGVRADSSAVAFLAVIEVLGKLLLFVEEANLVALKHLIL